MLTPLAYMPAAWCIAAMKRSRTIRDFARTDGTPRPSSLGAIRWPRIRFGVQPESALMTRTRSVLVDEGVSGKGVVDLKPEAATLNKVSRFLVRSPPQGPRARRKGARLHAL